ncbi:MAG: hypothetical protein IKN34_09295, partial [Treponema sp.]|nr:hypothetical protein [Treponema sp.]
SGGDSPLIDGSRGYYNFFNFGAAGGDVVGNGIAFAKSQGWDNVYKSIVGGAKLYYRDYLQYGQDTYYYKDFNVVNGNYDHQYAQGVYSPISSAVFLKNALSQDTSASLHLRIPVFREMPVQACPYPPKTDYYNPRYLPGVTKTGWVYKDGGWYYIKNNGTKKCGWLQDGGATYYLDSNGVMKTGWIFVNGYWYYMNTSGAMQTGWLDEGQNRYFLTPSGAMATGWVKDGGKNSVNSPDWTDKGFLQTAFTKNAQERILTTLVDNSADSTASDRSSSIPKADGSYSENPENYICEDTQDKIFLLSVNEVSTLFIFEKKEPTDYAKANGVFYEWRSDVESGYKKGIWWLRSPSAKKLSGTKKETVSYIKASGAIDCCEAFDKDCGIVPAMYVDKIEQ